MNSGDVPLSSATLTCGNRAGSSPRTAAFPRRETAAPCALAITRRSGSGCRAAAAARNARSSGRLGPCEGSSGGRVASIRSGLNAASRGEVRRSSSSIRARNPAEATAVRERSASSAFCDTRAETSARFAISAAPISAANTHQTMRMRGLLPRTRAERQRSSAGGASFITSRKTHAA